MRTLAIVGVVLLVTRVYLDPTSNGIESPTEAVLWAGLGIWMAVLIFPKRRGPGLMWKALAFHYINRKRRDFREAHKSNHSQSGRAHRNAGPDHQGSTFTGSTATRNGDTRKAPAARRSV